MQGQITPVLLSGGTGSRLWPLSRQSCPKPFLALEDDTQPAMLSTLNRIACYDALNAPITLAHQQHRFLVAEHLRRNGLEKTDIMLEPVGRGTAPAIIAAALHAVTQDADALLWILPVDHAWEMSHASLTKDLSLAAEAASAGQLVCFGVKPTRPATSYGYLHCGEVYGEGAFRVQSFVEKPSLACAEEYVANDDYLWNSGMFLFHAHTLLDEVRHWQPAMFSACQQAYQKHQRDQDFIWLEDEAYATCAHDSIDYAVMEQTQRAVVVPLSGRWSDLGTWDQLWELADKDQAQNVLHGQTVAEGTAGCYIRSEGPVIATYGVSDLIVVATQDAVLVADKREAEQVKSLVERLGATYPDRL
tara:strand:- start:378 stop:1457 length:1080 start_codon:yes stop_codon:yes gene_type:complete